LERKPLRGFSESASDFVSFRDAEGFSSWVLASFAVSTPFSSAFFVGSEAPWAVPFVEAVSLGTATFCASLAWRSWIRCAQALTVGTGAGLNLIGLSSDFSDFSPFFFPLLFSERLLEVSGAFSTVADA